jgi:Flp pilus assembly protein TadG
MPWRTRSERVDDRGSVSVFFVVAAIAMLVLIGLVVDGGGKIRYLQRADAAAAEAARQGGQAIEAAPAVQGQGVQVDAEAARVAAQDYLNKAGVDGSVTIAGGSTLEVQTSMTYTPIFLSLVGVTGMPVTGRASVRLARGPNGG